MMPMAYELASDTYYGLGVVTPRHMTTLHEAARAGELNICRLLLKHGADVMSKARDAWTPLHFASRHGHFVIVQELLVHNADVND